PVIGSTTSSLVTSGPAGRLITGGRLTGVTVIDSKSADWRAGGGAAPWSSVVTRMPAAPLKPAAGVNVRLARALFTPAIGPTRVTRFVPLPVSAMVTVPVMAAVPLVDARVTRTGLFSASGSETDSPVIASGVSSTVETGPAGSVFTGGS